jgi:hypothetical protein
MINITQTGSIAINIDNCASVDKIDGIKNFFLCLAFTDYL